ncbi:MAG: peptidylprolyl isomerase [Candidatus Peribacteraceae bacterium]|nr:peptidylprolyl isomerase [Candidatus Peribacteraceae bacterium]
MYKFIIPLFALAFLLVSCSPSSPAPNGGASSSSANSMPSVSFDGQILSGKHVVILRTSLGDITAELDADAAPKTVTNFVALAKSGYYDNLTFHRVIPDFMVQAGDPNGNGTGGRSVFGETFEDEINAKSYGLDQKKLSGVAEPGSLPSELKDLTVQQYFEQKGYVFDDKLQSLPMKRGAFAMANRGPNTNGSQFFIIQADGTPWLEGQHTVFGQVTDGLDVLDAIVATPRDASDKPVEPVTFTVEVVD